MTNHVKSLHTYKGLCQTFINWYSNLLVNQSNDRIDPTSFFQKVERRLVNRGPLDTISWLKGIRVIVYSWIAGNPENPGNIATYRDGLPKVLGPMITKALRKREPEVIRMVLTLLNVSREIEAWKEPDFQPIEQGPTWSTDVREDYRKNMKFLIFRLGIKDLHSKPKWCKFHFTSKSGPSGPAMLSIEHDFNNLIPSVRKAVEEIGGSELSMAMKEFEELPIEPHFSKKPIRPGLMRKIGLVKDTEGKTRIIAMADYWSQTSLKPLHERLLSDLKGIEMDVTFGQDIAPFGDDNQTYFSFDLTSATDRLPIFLYEDILELRFGPEYKDAWKIIMTEQGFQWEDRLIFYQTGQPMGLYSSWALLAHAHHFIVQYSAHKAGYRSTFRDYRLLGDDIVIRNDRVAREYQSVMTSLGVSISPTKTLVSKDTFEFAKRIFTRRQEVTAFPLNGLRSSLQTSWMDVCNIVETSERRGFISTWLKDFEWIRKFYKTAGVGTGLARVNYRNIIGHFAVTSGSPDLIYLAARLYKLPVTCVTSSTSIWKEMRSNYLHELRDLSLKASIDIMDILTNASQDIGRDLESGVPIFDDPPESISLVPQRFILEPMEWVLLDKWMEIQRIPLPDYSKTSVEDEIERLEKVDLRVPDPYIFDRSRHSERKFRVKASSSIKALGSMRDCFTPDYHAKELGIMF
jgi:hypothetical protein